MLTKTRISDGQNWNFTWDYRNRLMDVVVKNASGTVLSSQHNTYDVLNRRIGVSTTVSGVTTQMWTVYDGANTYADFDGNGNLTNRYLHGLAVDQLFGKMDSSGNTRWYLTDLLGSVRLLTTPSGGVLDGVNYDSFGNILSETNPANGDRFKYTGREWDSVSGQYNYRARELDPSSGRFISSDPLGFGGQDANWYRYVDNSPSIAIDPLGLQTVIVVTDQTPLGDSTWLTIINPTADQTTGVSGLQGLLDYINQFPDGSIDELIISGHGSKDPKDGQAGIGSSEGNIWYQLPQNAADQIERKMKPDGKITLAGCHTGVKQDQLDEFARKVRRKVYGAKGMVTYGVLCRKGWAVGEPPPPAPPPGGGGPMGPPM